MNQEIKFRYVYSNYRKTLESYTEYTKEVSISFDVFKALRGVK